MDAIAEKRYQALKRKLDALHYSQPLSKSCPNLLAIESAALVERLVNDLVKITDGFQTIKKQNEELKGNLSREQQLVKSVFHSVIVGTTQERK